MWTDGYGCPHQFSAVTSGKLRCDWCGYETSYPVIDYSDSTTAETTWTKPSHMILKDAP
jgi:hypothetical protein